MLPFITARRGPSRFGQPIEIACVAVRVSVPVAVRRGSRKWLKCLPSRFRRGVASQTPHTPLGLAPPLEGGAPPMKSDP